MPTRQAQAFISQFHNPFVERAATEAHRGLVDHYVGKGFSAAEAETRSVRLLNEIYVRSLPVPQQPDAVFNAGPGGRVDPQRNLHLRNEFLRTHPDTAYGDWDHRSTNFINQKFPFGSLKPGEEHVKLSLFNFNSGLVAMHAAREGKNIVPFVAGLHQSRSPDSIWAKTEFPTFLYEVRKHAVAANAQIAGMPAYELARSVSTNHMHSPELIFALSRRIGAELGDATRFDPSLALQGKQVAVAHDRPGHVAISVQPARWPRMAIENMAPPDSEAPAPTSRPHLHPQAEEHLLAQARGLLGNLEKESGRRDDERIELCARAISSAAVAEGMTAIDGIARGKGSVLVAFQGDPQTDYAKRVSIDASNPAFPAPQAPPVQVPAAQEPPTLDAPQRRVL
jgi:hypothetical protein